MTMYPWRAGERITAQRLRAGVQTGVASVEIDDGTDISSPIFSGDYHRGTAEVVFDPPFVSTPVILVTARSSVPGGTVIETTYTDQSAAGMTVMVARVTGTTTNVDWIAIGEPDLGAA